VKDFIIRQGAHQVRARGHLRTGQVVRKRRTMIFISNQAACGALRWTGDF
jgi:hypothetical protein